MISKRQFAIVVVSSIALASCAATPQDDPELDVESTPMTDESERVLPDGAIEVGDDVYMVPSSQLDSDGCRSYHLYSPIKRVNQAIHYRTADGRFVMNRLEADCSSDS